MNSGNFSNANGATSSNNSANSANLANGRQKTTVGEAGQMMIIATLAIVPV